MSGRHQRSARALLAFGLLLAGACSDVSITTVDPAVVEVSPSSSFLRVDATTHLSVQVRSQDGALLTGRSVTWRSLDETIASVDADGNVHGLAVGTATIRATVEGVSGTASVTVTSGPAVQLSMDTVEFSGVTGGANPGDRTVNVTNPGDGTLTGLSAGVEYAAGEPTGWLTADLSGTTAPASLVLRANQAGLDAGTYTALVRVSSPVASNQADSVVVRLTVLTPQPAIALDATSISFAAAENGADPASRDVAITNAGGGTLSGLSVSVSYAGGQPTGWLAAQLAGTTAPTTLTLHATTGSLAAGSYSATVSVASGVAQNSPRTIAVTFEVSPAQPVLSVTPDSLAFVATTGGANPASRSLEITNTGGGTLSGLGVSVTYPGGQPSGWLATSLSGTSAPATVTVSASTGSLDPGTYTATVTISAPGAVNTPVQVPVVFEVQPLLAPSTPMNVAARPLSSTSIEVSWEEDAAALLTSFEVQRAPTSDPSGFVTVATPGPLDRTWVDAALEPERTYYYRVRACNLTACSAWSEVASATTSPDTSLGVPQNVTAVALSSTQVLVSWLPGGGQDRFEVRRKVTGWTTIATNIPGTETSYTDSGLSPNTTYQYQVRACAGATCSTWSNTATAKTPQ